jgi:hypothetical protein
MVWAIGDMGFKWERDMAHEPAARPARESLRAKVHDARDLRAWCDEFDCPPHLVKNTLTFGVMVVDIRAYLEQAIWHKSKKTTD